MEHKCCTHFMGNMSTRFETASKLRRRVFQLSLIIANVCPSVCSALVRLVRISHGMAKRLSVLIHKVTPYVLTACIQRLSIMTYEISRLLLTVSDQQKPLPFFLH